MTFTDDRSSTGFKILKISNLETALNVMSKFTKTKIRISKKCSQEKIIVACYGLYSIYIFTRFSGSFGVKSFLEKMQFTFLLVQ